MKSIGVFPGSIGRLEGEKVKLGHAGSCQVTKGHGRSLGPPQVTVGQVRSLQVTISHDRSLGPLGYDRSGQVTMGHARSQRSPPVTIGHVRSQRSPQFTISIVRSFFSLPCENPR